MPHMPANAAVTEGRRRADTATPRPSAFGNDFPEHTQPTMQHIADAHPQPTSPPSPIEDAFAFTADRLDRLEQLLGSLNGTVIRAGSVLEPVLTGGSYDEPTANPEDGNPPQEDRRSTIARRITGHALRADLLADAVVYIERRVEAILDATEV